MNTNHEPRSWVQDDDSKSWREIAFDLQKQNINQRKAFEQKDQLIETMARQLDALKNTLQETKTKYHKEKNNGLIYAGLYVAMKKEYESLYSEHYPATNTQLNDNGR